MCYTDPTAEPPRSARWIRRPVGLARLQAEREALQLERAALAAEVARAKEAFLSVLGHELRTPINVVMGYASLMADDLAGPIEPLQREYLGQIMSGAEALLSLVNDLLDMGRIQAGRLTVAAGPVAFADLAELMIAELRPAALAKGLALELVVPAGLPPVQADEQRLYQVLRVLASNALKFTPAGGAVSVRAAAPAGRLRVEIVDTGIGIAAADMPRLFCKFEQLEGGLTRTHGGAGLGLAIAHSLIELHGGEIGANSEPGRGSTFWFELPLAPD